MVVLYEHTYSPKLDHAQNSTATDTNSEFYNAQPNKVNKTQQNTNSYQTTSVLCPTYNISKPEDGLLKCFARFPPAMCGMTVSIYLEVWLRYDRMVKSIPKKAFLDCNGTMPICTR